MQPMLDGKFIVAFVGTTNGIVQCDSFAELQAMLHDTYPNPGDPTLAYLLGPAYWLPDANGDPYFVETLVADNGYEDYRVAIYRVIEVAS